MVVVGQVVGGEFSKVIVRQKHDYSLSLGQLVVADCKSHKVLLQVFDLSYGSQISQQNLELISGLDMEQNSDLDVHEAHIRNYGLAFMKSLLIIDKTTGKICKELPDFLSKVREVEKEDLQFITTPKDPLFVGKLRSGNKTIDVDINLPGRSVLSEHVLIPASTGKGKSNLVKTMLWNLLDKDFCGTLVLDPHDEYFGRNSLGLKDHPSNSVKYYTPNNVPTGQSTLKISITSLKPTHFNGVVNLSDPQRMAIYAYYKKFGKDWINAIILERKLDFDFAEGTINVVRRTLMSLLGLRLIGGDVKSSGIFDTNSGESTISDIVSDLENSRIVILDTSSLAGPLEILVGSLVASELLRRYKFYKMEGLLNEKPVISVVLEEAPRVIGKDVLEKGSNIFSTIAREGRKFKVGLIAITQLPSLIPRQILANMNTKIILGVEMAPERQAIIDSSAQDLSDDNRNIASLDKGEAIITSNFARFATPVKIPFFDDIVKNAKKDTSKPSFSGIKLS